MNDVFSALTSMITNCFEISLFLGLCGIAAKMLFKAFNGRRPL